jgi:hypothetical protein
MSYIENRLEYYLTEYISNVTNRIKETKLADRIYKLIVKSRLKKSQDICKDYTLLTKHDYNKSIKINEINQYAILNLNINSSMSLNMMAKECLKNIIKSEKILLNNKPVCFKDCVLVDIIDTSNATFSGFHTDVEYSYFTGNAFNVWYLIENNRNYGNMYLIDSNDYKKKYTPCILINDSDYEKSNKNESKSIDLYSDSMYSTLFKKKRKKVGTLNDFKVVYTDMKNGDCLVMSKHVLHRGDEKRNNNVKGIHFRVLVKNDDGSVDYNKYYKSTKKFPHHIWDKENKKIFGVDLFDFA